MIVTNSYIIKEFVPPATVRFIVLHLSGNVDISNIVYDEGDGYKPLNLSVEFPLTITSRRYTFALEKPLTIERLAIFGHGLWSVDIVEGLSAVGEGDMSTMIYDVNGDGVVDKAEQVDGGTF